MNDIKIKIMEIFQNEKVLDLFINSDGGQGLIDRQIECLFSFDEIFYIIETMDSPIFFNFIENYENYHSLINFFKKLREKASAIDAIYWSSINKLRIIDIIKKNREKIHKNFLPLSEIDGQKEFIRKYIQKHLEIKYQTFEQSRDFFENPVEFV